LNTVTRRAGFSAGYNTCTQVLTPQQIACHGNRWRGTMDLAGPDAEAADIRKSFDRLQAATGRTDVPTAYFTGSGSAMHNHVRARVHKERGVPLLYCSDAYADDLPYYVTSPLALDGEKDEGLLMIPYSLTNNDRECHGAAVLYLLHMCCRDSGTDTR
jgi:peptidoglycan/xylan/chitin deacetylase (PgdA/CDA1 family)